MSRRGLLVCLLAPLLAVACAKLLGIRPQGPSAFEHRAHLLEGIACVQCHKEITRAGLDAPLDLPDTATCVGCHSEPHDTRPCGSCHGSERARHALRQAKQHLLFSHADHAEPSQGNCVRCHHAIASDTGPLRPTMATCLSCHQHAEQWAARDCGGCHRDLEAEQVRPASHLVHGENFLAAHGLAAAAASDLCTSCHAESMCAGCHGVSVPALRSELAFDRPHTVDMHGPGFLAHHALQARTDPATCLSCHSESSCVACHADKGLLQASATREAPHPPGWVSLHAGGGLHGQEARRDPLACASCHGGAGEQLCVSCHRVGAPGGSVHPPGFSSNKPLSEMPCRQCHMEAL